jgi:hypothetical protein
VAKLFDEPHGQRTPLLQRAIASSNLQDHGCDLAQVKLGRFAVMPADFKLLSRHAENVQTKQPLVGCVASFGALDYGTPHGHLILVAGVAIEQPTVLVYSPRVLAPRPAGIPTLKMTNRVTVLIKRGSGVPPWRFGVDTHGDYSSFRTLENQLKTTPFTPAGTP